MEWLAVSHNKLSRQRLESRERVARRIAPRSREPGKGISGRGRNDLGQQCDDKQQRDQPSERRTQTRIGRCGAKVAVLGIIRNLFDGRLTESALVRLLPAALGQLDNS